MAYRFAILDKGKLIHKIIQVPDRDVCLITAYQQLKAQHPNMSVVRVEQVR